MEINPYLVQLKDLSDRSQTLRGIFDYDLKAERLEEVLRELEDRRFGMIKVVAQAIAKRKGQFRKYHWRI